MDERNSKPNNSSEYRNHDRITTTPLMRSGGGKTIRYEGSKQDLIAAGVATEDMFPPEGRSRLYNAGFEVGMCETPKYFATTRRNDGFAVTRWRFWNNPIAAKEDERQQKAQDKHEQAAAAKGRTVTPARRRSAEVTKHQVVGSHATIKGSRYETWGVRYAGSMSDLIAAGAASAAMFPAENKKRRSTGGDNHSPEYFAISRKAPDHFTVTRWKFWNDPAGAEEDAIHRAGKLAARGPQDKRDEAGAPKAGVPSNVVRLVPKQRCFEVLNDLADVASCFKHLEELTARVHAGEITGLVVVALAKPGSPGCEYWLSLAGRATTNFTWTLGAVTACLQEWTFYPDTQLDD